MKDLSQDDLAFRAVQVSQIMALECWLLKGQISKENQESLGLVNSLEKHSIEIGNMIQKLREYHE
jgi:hypothetical protein